MMVFHKIQNCLSSRRGVGLAEALIAVLFLSIIVVGVMFAFLGGSRNERLSDVKVQGTSVAANVLEELQMSLGSNGYYDGAGALAPGAGQEIGVNLAALSTDAVLEAVAVTPTTSEYDVTEFGNTVEFTPRAQRDGFKRVNVNLVYPDRTQGVGA